MKNKNNLGESLNNAMRSLWNNKVVVMFVVLCVFGIATSGKSVSHTVTEVFTRFGRNAFLVLALIIPVLAGLGLNFGIVVGAIAAQIAIFWVVSWGFTGVTGLLMCVLICTPLAILFGWLVGKLYNKTKGSEMITGMILAYFADGLYQFLFLFLIGGVIPVNNPTLIINGGVGVKNTIDLTGNIKYALDTISMLSIIQVLYIILAVITAAKLISRLVKKRELHLKSLLLRFAAATVVFALTFVPAVQTFLGQDRLLLLNAVELACLGAALFAVYLLLKGMVGEKKPFAQCYKRPVALAIVAGIVYALTYVTAIFQILIAVSLPVCTYLLIAVICFFNRWILSTKLGQDMRTVGQSRTVANSAGINVDKTRIIATCISTVLASWGQLIYLQNLGTFQTYGAHSMVGQYAIASLLVGGASVQKANNKQAILGVVLFHTLFVVAPLSASNLFGSALIGEYFRVFICYGVIALSLAMHAWKVIAKKKEEKAQSDAAPAES